MQTFDVKAGKVGRAAKQPLNVPKLPAASGAIEVPVAAVPNASSVAVAAGGLSGRSKKQPKNDGTPDENVVRLSAILSNAALLIPFSTP